MVRYANLFLACLLGSTAASSVPSDMSVDKRGKQVSDNGRLHCGVFGSGSKDNIENLFLELYVGRLKDKMFNIPPGMCNRVHCYQTTAIYVCNDGNLNAPLKGEWIGKVAKCIFSNCCKTDWSGVKQNKGVSGQYFIKGMGQNFNVVVGYGNCNDPVDVRPTEALGWGVNGACVGGVLVPGILQDCNF